MLSLQNLFSGWHIIKNKAFEPRMNTIEGAVLRANEREFSEKDVRDLLSE